MTNGHPTQDASQAKPKGHTPRPWIGVNFTCAGAYVRVYRRPEQNCYIARCPRCGMTCRFPVGSGGTSQRLFDATCR